VVGRIVEEILTKTKGRVVIVDTNGDFRQSHQVLEKEHRVWGEGNQKIEACFWDRDKFEKRWKEITRIQFVGPSETVEHTERVFFPLISWGKLPIDWQIDVLGVDIGRHHEEIAALHDVLERLAREDDPVSPQRLIRELDSFARFDHSFEAPPKAESALKARLNQAVKLGIWKQKEDELDLGSAFASDIEGRPQLSIFDLPSIINVTSRNILLSYLLKTLWEVALLDWEKASEDAAKVAVPNSEEASEAAPKHDKRTPIFIVIDEAHNFVPADDPIDPYALRISQSIQRIAAEGRKYGLFLLLATQRPSKVRPGLLSECENLCLLRLRSPIERGLAVDTWALRDDNRHPRLSPLAKYKRGYGLLFGHWTGWDEISFKAGQRRTRPTGGDLPKTWIPSVAVDPSSE
jgi:hypothetical protein